MTSQSDNLSQAIAGAGGGALSMVVTYPLITLSTRAQIERRKSLSSEPGGLPTAKSERRPSEALDNASKSRLSRALGRLTSCGQPSLLSAAGKIIQREGISGLYSGLDSALFGITITNFVYYYFYEGTRAMFEKRKRMRPASSALEAVVSSGVTTMSTLESMIAGAIAGSATVVVTNPIWVVNTRMTVRSGGAKTPKSTVQTIKDIIEKDGFKAFLAGIFPALVLVINPILQYTIFERLKALIEKRRKLKPFDYFILGALGKLVATITTYPYITVKSRMQVQRSSKTKAAGEKSSEHSDLSSDEPVYTGTISAIKQIAKQESIASLYNGIDSKLVQSVLTSAFLFYFKEQLVTAAQKVVRGAQHIKK
ncbi:mitochondrial carrier domain-containing protein [Dipodascopsis uninucleata]